MPSAAAKYEELFIEKGCAVDRHTKLRRLRPWLRCHRCRWSSDDARDTLLGFVLNKRLSGGLSLCAHRCGTVQVLPVARAVCAVQLSPCISSKLAFLRAVQTWALVADNHVANSEDAWLHLPPRSRPNARSPLSSVPMHCNWSAHTSR